MCRKKNTSHVRLCSFPGVSECAPKDGTEPSERARLILPRCARRLREALRERRFCSCVEEEAGGAVAAAAAAGLHSTVHRLLSLTHCTEARDSRCVGSLPRSLTRRWVTFPNDGEKCVALVFPGYCSLHNGSKSQIRAGILTLFS